MGVDLLSREKPFKKGDVGLFSRVGLFSGDYGMCYTYLNADTHMDKSYT